MFFAEAPCTCMSGDGKGSHIITCSQIKLGNFRHKYLLFSAYMYLERIFNCFNLTYYYS